MSYSTAGRDGGQGGEMAGAGEFQENIGSAWPVFLTKIVVKDRKVL
jgi:hypothetical protein